MTAHFTAPPSAYRDELALTKLFEAFARERTFDNLSASLGEDRARSVIVGIGQAALASAPDLSGGALGAVVSQTIAKLSQQDLSGLARNESSAVGRVQALVQEEIKSQKTQQAPVNRYAGPDKQALGDGLRGAGMAASTSSRDSGRRFTDIREPSATDAANLAREIGIRGGDASLLGGATSHMRDAIRAFVKDGKAISDDDVRSVGDVKAVMALVRSGKLKEDDPRVPPSIRSIMQDMKKDGIDPATAKTEEINGWLKTHPAALEAAKKQNRIDDNAAAKLTPDQKADKVQEKPKTVSPSQTTPAAKANAPKSSL